MDSLPVPTDKKVRPSTRTVAVTADERYRRFVVRLPRRSLAVLLISLAALIPAVAGCSGRSAA